MESDALKILIITPYADPEKGAAVVRVNAFREYFEEKGARVNIFAPQREGVQESRGVKRYSGIKELMLLVLSEKFDAVIGTSPPLTHNFFALLAAKARGSKFLLDAKDPFTEVMQKLEPEKAASWKFSAYRFMESFTHKNSDRVIFLNKPNLEKAQKEFSLDKDRLLLAPNGSNTRKIFFSERDRKALRKKLGIKGMLLVFVGGIGDKDLVGFAENAFPEMSEKLGAHVLFILSFDGSPRNKETLENLKEALKRKGVSKKAGFEFNVEYEQLYKYLSAADIGLVAYPDFEMHVIGAKVFDYIAAGLPIASKASKGNAIQKEFLEKNAVGFQEGSWARFTEKFLETEWQEFSREKIIGVALKNSREKTCEKVLNEINGLVKVRGK